MRAEEREVAGLRCGEVLERLADYLDGALAADEVARVEGHLRGCDVCARFGGRYQETVEALRRHLGVVEALDDGIAARLRARLDAE